MRGSPSSKPLAHIGRAATRSALRGLNRLLAPLEIQIVNTAHAVCDLRGIVHEPHTARFHTARPALVDVPSILCRTPFANLPLDDEHPFVATLHAHAQGRCRDYASSPLRGFYETWQPRSAAELLGLDSDETSGVLRRATASAATPPWSALPPEAHHRMVIEVADAENGAADPLATFEDGVNTHGPVSDRKGQLELERLVRLKESVVRNGYRRSNEPDGDISGIALVRDRESRVLVRQGQHRAAVLASLGHDPLPIRLAPVPLRRDEASSWPNVVGGLYRIEEALRVFDRLFEGTPPHGCRWPHGAKGSPPSRSNEAGARAGSAPIEVGRAAFAEAPR